MILLLAAVIMMTLAFTLTGCGSDDSSSGSSTSATEAAPTEEQGESAIPVDDTTFVSNGVAVPLNAEVDAIIAALGEPNDTASETSCHGIGLDKKFYYDGFLIKTYPVDDVDYVLEVLINTPGVATAKGIEIGSTKDEVIAAYGDGYTLIGKAIFNYKADEGKTLRFTFEDDAVVEIDYFYNV